MCWRGILDAPGAKQAADAAAGQLRRWSDSHPDAERVVGEVHMAHNADKYAHRNGAYAVWADGSYEPFDKLDGLFIDRFAPLSSSRQPVYLP